MQTIFMVVLNNLEIHFPIIYLQYILFIYNIYIMHSDGLEMFKSRHIMYSI